jgi:hypothetical protein
MKVYKECCKNCLLSQDAIVSPQRVKGILNTCKKEQSHFICHKASMEGKDICCKSFYDKMGGVSQLIRISERLGVIEFVEQPDHEKMPTYKEMNQ